MKPIISLILIIIALQAKAQSPLIWSTDLFCENNNLGANAVSKPVIDAQGNIYVAASLMLAEEGYNRTPVVVKLNANGDTLWRYEQERSNVPFPYTASYFSDIALDASGNIFAIGVVPVVIEELGIFAKPIIAKIDPNGNLLWSQLMFENISSENVAAGVLAVDNEGSAYFTGRRSITFQQYNAFVWKFSGTGDLLWTHTYALSGYRTTYYNIAFNSAQDKLYLTGDVASFNGAQTLNLIEVFDPSNGTVINSLRNATTPNSVYSETEATYIDANENVYVSLYDANGAAIINKYDDTLGLVFTYMYYPTESYDNSFAKIIGAGNGEIYAAGYTYASSNSNTGRGFYVRLASDGTEIDSFVFPSSVEEYIYDCVKIADEIVFTGATVNSNNKYVIKVWHIHVMEGYIGNYVYNKQEIISSEGLWVTENNESAYVSGALRTITSGGFSVLKLNPYLIATNIPKAEQNFDFHVYPNPFTDQIQFEIPVTQSAELLVTNLMGQIIYREAIFAQDNSKQLNLSELPSGVYFLNVINNKNKNSFTKKIVKL
jgi:hypothetical protein